MHPHLDCYLVGGAVRDILLGLNPKDRDYCVVGADDGDMLAFGFRKVGEDFPVYLHPVTKEEYALARFERKTEKGYAGFSFETKGVTLEEDLYRRDLTINAMAMDKNSQLIDPYGGQKDLKNGILRHVSEAFAEDPVRILRVCRFAARYNFSIADETKELMKTMVDNGEFDALTKERVMLEFTKVSSEPYLMKFFDNLKEIGALAKLGKFETLFNPDFKNLINQAPTHDVKNYFIFADFSIEEMSKFGLPRAHIDTVGYLRKWKPVSTFYTYMNEDMKLQFMQDLKARHEITPALELASNLMYIKGIPYDTTDFEVHKLKTDIEAIKSFNNKEFIDNLNSSNVLKSLSQSDKNSYIQAELKNKYSELLFTHNVKRPKMR